MQKGQYTQEGGNSHTSNGHLRGLGIASNPMTMKQSHSFLGLLGTLRKSEHLGTPRQAGTLSTKRVAFVL